MFFLVDLVSASHQITAHKDTDSLTACYTHTGLYEWLIMPQGSSALNARGTRGSQVEGSREMTSLHDPGAREQQHINTKGLGD